LSEQTLAIYHKMFVETDNASRTTCRIDEYFDITIGKTPPRKEKKWFSKNPIDCVWISISDMGSCGTFITDSSEYLTRAAVDKHNVKVVPDNTVILSFKLTVGRVAITVGETTTNEAIAHFNTSKDNITEYLYCYLKSFDFDSLGSTSSIGTAVNSKTIKAMEFVNPEEKELQEFCDIVRPMFEQIKKNQFENQYLEMLRDSLLPKLMSGELDVSDLKL
jgi:type I restriction enzyme S subunit